MMINNVHPAITAERIIVSFDFFLFIIPAKHKMNISYVFPVNLGLEKTTFILFVIAHLLRLPFAFHEL